MKWEYYVLDFEGTSKEIEAFLDAKGENNWELIQIIGNRYFFKRTKEEE